ncbi:MAG: hypothetical protein ACD_77C00401G0001 [uncultured bacterium]|nr:MAG: hypothetical protein ACD_77C00401G0001 [uncultured bacterium]
MMRKIIIILVVAIFATSMANAQTIMNIHMKGGGATQIPVDQIEKITFTGGFLPSAEGTVTDIDGNVYPITKIGNQIWMAADLKVTRYRNGEAIKVPGTNREAWSTNTEGALAWYENDEYVYKQSYGALYNYFAVVNPKGLCPAGWHTPSNQEWKILQEFLGGWREAGKKLKSEKSGFGTHPRWTGENTGGTNETKFSALPSGYRHKIGTFGDIGLSSTYWSSTELNATDTYNWVLKSNSGQFNGGWALKNSGFAVRCVKN